MTGRDGRFLHQSRIKTLGPNVADYAALTLPAWSPVLQFGDMIRRLRLCGNPQRIWNELSGATLQILQIDIQIDSLDISLFIRLLCCMIELFVRTTNCHEECRDFLVQACCDGKAINSRRSRTANNFATCGDSRVPAVSSTTSVGAQQTTVREE